MYFSRGKNKIENPYNIPDAYNFYISDIGNNEIYFVEESDYRKIVNDFYKSIMEGVLKKNVVFKMPFNLGNLRVVKSKISLDRLNILGVDWKQSVSNGKYIYHLNEHSRGYKYYFFWEKRGRKNKNMFFYRLVLSRTNKRMLAKLIKSNKYDYFEM
jgi:hypothetical protein